MRVVAKPHERSRLVAVVGEGVKLLQPGRTAARPRAQAVDRSDQAPAARDAARHRRQGAHQGARGAATRGSRPRTGKRCSGWPRRSRPRTRTRAATVVASPHIRSCSPRKSAIRRTVWRRSRSARSYTISASSACAMGCCSSPAARRRRMAAHARAPGARVRHRVEDRDAAPDHAGRPQSPRALGWHRLPRQDSGRRDPAGRSHRRDRRRVRCDGHRSTRTRRRCRSRSARRVLLKTAGKMYDPELCEVFCVRHLGALYGDDYDGGAAEFATP